MKVKTALTFLSGFWHFTERLKLYLVKTKVHPILDYTPTPTNMASHPKMLLLQTLQNKALRLPTGQKYPYTENTEAQHPDSEYNKSAQDHGRPPARYGRNLTSKTT